MSGASMTIEGTFEAAKRLGLVVRLPQPKELFLDIDSKEDYTHFTNMVALLPGVETWVKTPSKSGYPKCHIVVNMSRPIRADERILLQACLGSDRKHELLSYLRHCDGNESPSVFFEKI